MIEHNFLFRKKRYVHMKKHAWGSGMYQNRGSGWLALKLREESVRQGMATGLHSTTWNAFYLID